MVLSRISRDKDSVNRDGWGCRERCVVALDKRETMNNMVSKNSQFETKHFYLPSGISWTC